MIDDIGVTGKMVDDLGLTSSKSVMVPPKTVGLFGTKIGENSPIVQFLRGAAQNARQGGKMMNQSFQPQNQSVALNALMNTPGTLADIGSNLVAGAIEPESVLTSGALEGAQLASPLIKAGGKFIGNAAEKLSGLAYDTPGVLGRVVENPSLPFKPGVEAANETYSQLVDRGQVRPQIAMNLDKKDLVNEAINAIYKGDITPDEAFIARKTIGQIKNTIPQDTFFELKKAFDDIAKTKFAGADMARAVAEDAENLRNILPLNKSGTSSIVKTAVGLGGALEGTRSPYSYLLGPIMSPFAQGATASGIGLARQGIAPLLANPVAAGVGLSSYLNRNR